MRISGGPAVFASETLANEPGDVEQRRIEQTRATSGSASAGVTVISSPRASLALDCVMNAICSRPAAGNHQRARPATRPRPQLDAIACDERDGRDRRLRARRHAARQIDRALGTR